jgi:hypothetical protein
MPTHAEIAARTGLTTEQVAAVLAISADMTAEASAYTQYGISVGDRVSLVVSSEPDDVTGTVERLYLDAINFLCADVRLRNGEIFPQNVEFLTRVGSGEPTYAQTVTRLAREWNAAAVDGRVSKQVSASVFRRPEDAAEHAGISQDDATDDLYDEIDADGPGAR